MNPRVEFDLESLARQMADPTPSAGQRLWSVGDLRAVAPDAPPKDFGRCQTLLVVPNRFLLLVDQFRGERVEPFALRLTSAPTLAEGSLHALGDYFPVTRTPTTIEFTQQFIQGRFLIALTREPAAVRVLNGWSIEVRSRGRVYYLMHSNLSRKLRPLGPFQTDARYALSEWSAANDVLGNDATLQIIQANQVLIGEQRSWKFATAVDGTYR